MKLLVCTFNKKRALVGAFPRHSEKTSRRFVDSSIMQGVPVIMSTPHFLDGDPELAAAIDGIQPVHDKHVTYLHVEPLSGGDITWHAS